MDSDRWDRIESLCWRALRRPSPERSAYLERACDGDASLRREVEELLHQLEADPSFLEDPLFRVPDVADPDPRERYLGPYRVVRPLGSGGMGEVFLAVHEAEELELPVAVKVMRRGLDAETAMRRFRVEQRILASLRHSSIAQLLDAGVTDDGRPFFVMEYVEGTPVDDYADARRLSLERRLALFRKICGAVQHAHQNLVLHRDLKPGNILVSDDGEPKLLDFGIGKILAGGDAPRAIPTTRADERPLTPEYASPEQLRREAVGTATDVHGLGILLYRLLTGHHPFRAGDQPTGQVERAILEEEPVPPSSAVTRALDTRALDGSTETVSARELAERRRTDPRRLRRALSGDLDTIVLKALRKEPSRRYGSVAALEEDVRRHLEGLPIRARRSTLTYRAGRFLKRHAWAVATAAVVVLALIGSSVVTHVQSQRVARERDRALEVRGFLLEMFGAAGADATADSVTARALLDRQSALLESAYRNRPELRAEMMHVLAEGYERLGLYRDALPLARDALALRRRVLGPRHPEVGATLATLGWIHRQRGDPRQARPLLEDAVSILRNAGEDERDRLSRALNDLGALLDGQGEREEAERVLREALSLRTELLGPEHRSVGITANNLMALLYRKGEYAGSVEMGQRALRALRNSLGADHQRTVIVQNNLAAVAAAMGDLEEAELQYRDLLDRQSRLQGRDHPVTIGIMLALATVSGDAGRTQEARELAREALAHAEERLGPDHPEVAEALGLLGTLARARGEYAEGRRHLRRALEIQRRTRGEEHEDVGETLAHLGGLARAEGDLEEAERRYRQAISVYEASVGPDHPRTAAQRERLGDLLLAREQPGEALTVLRQTLDAALDRLSAHHPLIHRTRIGLAEAYMALGQAAVADSLLDLVRPALEQGELRPDERERIRTLTASLQALDEAPR